MQATMLLRPRALGAQHLCLHPHTGQIQTKAASPLCYVHQSTNLGCDIPTTTTASAAANKHQRTHTPSNPPHQAAPATAVWLQPTVRPLPGTAASASSCLAAAKACTAVVGLLVAGQRRLRLHPALRHAAADIPQRIAGCCLQQLRLCA